MGAGRPLKFKTVEELEIKIKAYFDDCDEKKRPYTMTGLANALDTTRETLLDYQHKKKYSYSIKKAKSKCEQYAEENLFRSSQVAGIIFNLKNNYNRWVDRQEMGLDTPYPLSVNFIPKPKEDLKSDTDIEINE
jgi:recombination DNA repair RAD52 pathway protein